jgi:REP element-mobilizing transposase RayT
MPQSLTNIIIHITFSTKDRLPLLRDSGLRAEMHRLLGGISNSMNCQSIVVGGVKDHVHILGRQASTVALADWVKELKRQSSAWAKRRSPELQDFSWQAGYGAFSVSQSGKKKAIHYIANQDEHHRKETFQDEYRRLLKLHEIDWNEQYVWG